MSEDSSESLGILDVTLSCKIDPNTFEDKNVIKDGMVSEVSCSSSSNRERSSSDQLKHMFEFMTMNLLTKGSEKGKRNNADIRNLWKKLTEELNNLGPPRRTTTEWKKIWASNKFKLRKKLSIKYSSSRMSSFGHSMDSLDTQVKGIFVQKQYSRIQEKISEVQSCGKILNKMEKLQKIRQSCRICLENAIQMKSLERKFLEMYVALMGKPLESHGLSSMKICERCITELTRAYKFQLLCLKTEEQIVSLKTPEIAPDCEEDSLKNKNSQEKIKASESLPDSTIHQLCNHCGKMLKAESMKAHLKRHEADQEDPNVRPFICSECGRSYKTLCNLQSHMSYTHTKSKSFKCRFCEDIFTSYFRKRLHESKCKLQQQIPNHPCPICHQIFSHSSKRDDHVRVRHTFERPFRCLEAECEKSFFTKRVLRRHIMASHSSKSKISCSVCNKSLRSWRSLATHMNSHDDQQASESKCLETFSEENILTLHMQKCTQCHLKPPIEIYDTGQPD